MAIQQRLLATGIAPLTATNIIGDQSAALTATGTTQATALLLGAVNNYVGTTAASTGVQLPSVGLGDSIVIGNAGASTLSVYGQTGDTIDGGAANAAFSVATNTAAIFYKMTSTAWVVILSA